MKTVLVVTLGRAADTADITCVGARDAAKLPAMHRTATTTGNDPVRRRLPESWAWTAVPGTASGLPPVRWRHLVAEATQRPPEEQDRNRGPPAFLQQYHHRRWLQRSPAGAWLCAKSP